MRRKQTHCLFIEEESYNWSAPNSAKHYRLIAVSVLVIVAGLLFSLYASRQSTLTPSSCLQGRRDIEGLLAAQNRDLDLISRCGSAQPI